MSYWYQMYRRPTRTPRLEVENGEARFESLMAKGLSERDRRLSASSVWSNATPQHLY